MEKFPKFLPLLIILFFNLLSICINNNLNFNLNNSKTKSLFKLNGLKYYILPIKVEGFIDHTTKTNYTENEIIKSLSNIRHTTSLSIGTPKITLPFELSFDSFSLYISSNKISQNIPTYNPSSSSTFVKYSDEKIINEYQKCSLCLFAKESFHIYDNNKLETIPDVYFVLGNELNINSTNISASIGLKPKKTLTDIVDDNLITQLRKKYSITEFSFRIRYSKTSNKNLLNNAELIIGAYPHQYLENIYNDTNFKYFYFEDPNLDTNQWQFPTKEINYGLITIINSYRIQFKLDTIFTKTSKTFSIIISFFEQLIEKDICEILTINDFDYYICNENINITQMKDLIFYPENGYNNINITFSPSELFYKFIDKNGNNKLIYLICFNSNFSGWELGNIFIKKYQPIFDFDKKIIGFYDQLFPDEEDNFNKKDNNTISKENNIMTLLIIVCLVLGMIIIGGGIGFYFYVKKNNFRTKRANELNDDNYVYESNIEKLNNVDINAND